MSTVFIYLQVLLVLFLFAASPSSERRIVALGDLHGDLNQTFSALLLTGLVDRKMRWIGKDAYLVQLGDVLDVGPDDIEIVRLFMRLVVEARAAGGDVIQLLGNHEIRNLNGDFRPVNPETLIRIGGERGRAQLLSNKTSVGMYLRTRKAIFRYGDFLFVHGGLSEETEKIITGTDKFKKFNNAMRMALVDGILTPMGKLGLDMSEKKKVANPILVRSSLNVPCKELTGILHRSFPEIKAVVVGHVPHNRRVFSHWCLCDGHLLAIDFGLSRWKKGDPGHVAALEIDSSSGHVKLLKSTIDYDDVDNSVRLSLKPNPECSFPFFKLSGVVIFLLLILGLLVMWILLSLRNSSSLVEEKISYGSTTT